MNREAQKALLADILANVSDVGKVSEILTTLAEDYVEVSTNLDLLTTSNDKLKADNESLLQQNMNLFLKVGTPIQAPGTETPAEDTEDAAPAFEDLFGPDGKLL